jgi:hypothetical protein
VIPLLALSTGQWQNIPLINDRVIKYYLNLDFTN